MATVTFTIDGRSLTVEQGTTVLQAALDHHIPIPYYCYHPALGIDGNCRVCIVKVEKMPKLQVACSTVATEGMVVLTNTDEVVKAREGVFEFLLINHPLDCPVCDKGGECPLQDFSYTFGPDGSRFEFPKRVFGGEGVKGDIDFGPTLMLNRNRCIMCTRCVRFMQKIDGDAQINIVDRGYGSEIATFQDEGVHSLLSGNLMDVCPVGAITTKDYRFAARPWDNPATVDTICTLCSKGCNVTAWLRAKPEWAKGARLVRITPRFNRDVNGYWMCDIGRFGYHFVEGEDRIGHPMLRGADGQLAAASWSKALARIAERPEALKNVHFLVSAHASLEELYLTKRLARELVDSEPITVSWRVQPKSQPANTLFKVPAEDAPNVRGARALGLVSEGSAGQPIEKPDLAALRAAIERGEVPALYVIDPGPAGSIGDLSWLLAARAKLQLLIVQTPLMTDLAGAADIVLPGGCYVEKDAAYMNDHGLVQAASQVFPPPGDALEDWQILVNLASALKLRFTYATSAAVRAELARVVPALAAVAGLELGRQKPARTLLQVSNVSERYKWEEMFHQVAPLKFAEKR